MPLIPIPPIAFRILLGFCFAVLFLTLSLLSTTTAIYYLLLSTIYCFQGFFYIHFKHACFSYFEKNKPNNKHQALHAILCPLCLIASLFSLLLSNFSKNKKKSFVFTILQRPPFCLKLKGHWWHPSGQTQWSSPRQFPSLSHIIKLFSQQRFIGSYPVCPLQAFCPLWALALCSFSACKSLICTWDGLSSWSGLWNGSEPHFQSRWQLGFRKTSQGGSADGGQMVWEARESSGCGTAQLLLAWLRSPLLGHSHLLGFLTTRFQACNRTKSTSKREKGTNTLTEKLGKFRPSLLVAFVQVTIGINYYSTHYGLRWGGEEREGWQEEQEKAGGIPFTRSYCEMKYFLPYW